MENEMGVAFRSRKDLLASGWLWPGASLLVSALAYGGLYSVHMRYGTLSLQATPQTLSWVALAFAGYIAALVTGEMRRGFPRWVLWTMPVLASLLLMQTRTTLTDDVYRYLWDGYLATQGVSPYAHPIEAPELDYLDNEVRRAANHTWMASPYLPVAQWIFAAVAWTLPLTPMSMQEVFGLIALLNGLWIVALLRRAGLPEHRALIYLWNPLVLIESAQGAHVDAWMAFLTLAAFWLALRPPSQPGRSPSWNIAAPLVLALATLTKILPALSLAVLFWRWKWRGLFIWAGATLALLLPAGLRAGWGLTGELDGRGLFGAVRIYGNQWNFNSGLFYWSSHWLNEMFTFANGLADAEVIAKLCMAALLLALLVVVCLTARRATPRQLLRLAALSWLGYLLLTTTVHPWYALLLIAFLPFVPPAEDEGAWRWVAALPGLYLSAALFTSYWTYVNPSDVREYAWVRLVEWLPTYALIVAALIAAYRQTVASWRRRSLSTNESSTRSTIS